MLHIGQGPQEYVDFQGTVLQQHIQTMTSDAVHLSLMTMTPHAHDYSPLITPGSRKYIPVSTLVTTSLSWHRALIVVSQLCFSSLFCSFFGWSWLGIALNAFSVLVLLGVAFGSISTDLKSHDQGCSRRTRALLSFR